MDQQTQIPDSTSEASCIHAVTNLFPEICPEYIQTIAEPLAYDTNAVINRLIDLSESGTSYTRRSQAKVLKRKRSEDEDDTEILKAKRKYCNPNRPANRNEHIQEVKTLISGDFPLVHGGNINTVLSENGQNLAPSYIALCQLVNNRGEGDRTLRMKKHASAQVSEYMPDKIDETIKQCKYKHLKKMLKELRAARLIRASLDSKRRKEAEAKEAERQNFESAKACGDVAECECCFTECAMNRMVHCEADAFHWFCYDCARRNAETQVGLSKYELTCMSMDECPAGFSHAQKEKFLDNKLSTALDRVEQEAVLRLAAIENLTKCPFCPFAAECLPVSTDREFRCENPDCKIVSCRLCNDETHIPFTCDEAARRNGVPARREIEEAMTAALIRNCNKCGTPFIKELGCNKMQCTRQGCRNTQCYICSQSCDYSHFNDPRRGGKDGNCPLFDLTENRHEEDVRKAEIEAKRKVTEKHPDLDPELLNIEMSEKVAEDDKRRRGLDAFIDQRPIFLGGRAPAVGADVAAGPAAGLAIFPGILPGPNPQGNLPGYLAMPEAHNVIVQGHNNVGQHQAFPMLQGANNNLQAFPKEQPLGAVEAQAAAQAATQARIQQRAIDIAELQNNFGQLMRQQAADRDRLLRLQAINQPHDQRNRPIEGPPRQREPIQLQASLRLPNIQVHNHLRARQAKAKQSSPRSQAQRPQWNLENNPGQANIQDGVPGEPLPPLIMGNGLQEQKGRATENRAHGWLDRLQGFDLGFGPMQGLDFGRAIINNGQELFGQIRSHNMPGREANKTQFGQQENQKPANGDGQSLAHQARWGPQDNAFRAQYGPPGQGPAQQR